MMARPFLCDGNLLTPLFLTLFYSASIAVGLLQFIALNFQDTVWVEHRLYLRTQWRDLPSEKTVKQIIAQLFIMQFFRHSKKMASFNKSASI